MMEEKMENDGIMIKTATGETSFRMFQEMLTSYRFSRILMAAHHIGVFESVGHDRVTISEICCRTGMDNGYGARFLHVLQSLGFMECHGDGYSLSDFSKTYLIKTSERYQGASLAFERKLEESWDMLEQTLTAGRRLYSTREKTPEEYRASLDLYLESMDNAAIIRAKELWNVICPGPSGVILDVGAGSGAFISEFLNNHKAWRGIFCDLNPVVQRAGRDPRLHALKDRLEFRSLNFLEPDELKHGLGDISADIVLVSNVVHCQGQRETESFLSGIVPCMGPNGLMIIHDFFSDDGFREASYDLHMMLNTTNGRTYCRGELKEMLGHLGISGYREFQLPSLSAALVFFKEKNPETFTPEGFMV